jgi:hypothetical protein
MVKFHTDIASFPDCSKVVFEIFVDGEQIVEINQEGTALELEIYPKCDGSPWRLPLGEFVGLLKKAKQTLYGRRS